MLHKLMIATVAALAVTVGTAVPAMARPAQTQQVQYRQASWRHRTFARHGQAVAFAHRQRSRGLQTRLIDHANRHVVMYRPTSWRR